MSGLELSTVRRRRRGLSIHHSLGLIVEQRGRLKLSTRRYVRGCPSHEPLTHSRFRHATTHAAAEAVIGMPGRRQNCAKRPRRYRRLLIEMPRASTTLY